MRFETALLLGALVTCAYFSQDVRGSLAEGDETLRKRNEEAQWLLTKVQDEKMKLQNEIEILTRRAEAPELIKRLGKVDMTQGYNPHKTRAIHEGVGYSIAYWGSDDSGSNAGNKQTLHKNGDLKITVDKYDQSGKEISPEKRNQIKKQVEAKMMGNLFE